MQITDFWQRYVGGFFKTRDAFSEGVRVQRLTNDATNTSADRFLRTIADDIEFTAPKRLAFPSAISSTTALKQHERADWQQTDPRIQLFAATLIEVCRKRNIPMFVHSAFRTKAEQDKHFANGTSKVKWPNAAHCQGKAVDIVHGVYAWELTRQEWSLVGKLGKDVLHRLNAARLVKDRFELEWGGDWSFYDPAHWEIKGWRNNISVLPAADPVRKTPRLILSKS